MSTFRPNSLCARIRGVIASRPEPPPDTTSIAAEAGVDRYLTSRLLSRMRRMGYVRQAAPATLGRYGRPATWKLESTR